jgi:hypothetical protein
MVPIHPSNGAKPYTDDIEYVSDLTAAVKAKAFHLAARIEVVRNAEEKSRGIGIVRSRREPEEPDVARLAAVDERLWSQTEARRRASRDAGVVLGLDALCEKHDLDEVERQVVILALMPCCGLELFDQLGQLAAFSFALMSVTPEMIAVFTDLDLRGRMALLDQLSPSGRLAQAGIIELEAWGKERVQDSWSSGVFVTDAAFDRIMGRETADDAQCPCCGQTDR